MTEVRNPESRVPSRRGLGLLALAILATACGSAGGLNPVAYPDPAAPCPAGRAGWRLDVVDRRARREGSEGVVSLVRESIRRSFPGCKWDDEAGADAGAIRIEIFRFASSSEGDVWEAVAGWTVVASDAAGRSLTEFETDEEVSRPNYRGVNNAREALREAFDRALRRTLEGLRVVIAAEAGCLPGRTGEKPVDSTPTTPARHLSEPV